MSLPNSSTEAAPAATPIWVAEQFVSKYYDVLEKLPQLISRFYKDDSSFSVTEVLREGEEHQQHTESAQGLAAIQDKVMSTFQGAAARPAFNGIQAQHSLGQGVLLQVAGIITSQSSQRRFSQTFFLATQEKGYYVLNDILHISPPHATAGAVVEAKQPLQNGGYFAAEQHQADSSVSQAYFDEPAPANTVYPTSALPQTVASLAPEAPQPAPVAAPPPLPAAPSAVEPAPAAALAPAATLQQQEQQEEAPAAPAPATEVSPPAAPLPALSQQPAAAPASVITSAQPAPAQVPAHLPARAVSPVKSPAPPAAPVNLTYAERLKNGKALAAAAAADAQQAQAANLAAAAEAKPELKAANGLPAEAVAGIEPLDQEAAEDGHQAAAADSDGAANGDASVGAPDPSVGVYIRNLPQDNVTVEMLEAEFSKLGSIRGGLAGINIVTSPRFGKVAYIKYNDVEAVDAAIKKVITLSGRRLSVQRMLPEFANGPATGRAGYRGGGGGSSGYRGGSSGGYRGRGGFGYGGRGRNDGPGGRGEGFGGRGENVGGRAEGLGGRGDGAGRGERPFDRERRGGRTGGRLPRGGREGGRDGGRSAGSMTAGNTAVPAAALAPATAAAAPKAAT